MTRCVNLLRAGAFLAVWACAGGAWAKPAADPRGEYVPLPWRAAPASRLRLGAEVRAPEATPYLPDLQSPGGLESLGLAGLARYDFADAGAPAIPYVGGGVGVTVPINDPDLLGVDRTFLTRLDKTDVGPIGFLGVEAPVGERLRLFTETRWRRDRALESLSGPSGARDDLGVFGGFELKFGGSLP